MLNKVEVRNDKGDFMTLPMGVISNGVEVLGIDGLDPVKTDFSTSKFAALRGLNHQASSTGLRQIIMNLGLNTGDPQSSVSQIRNRLYTFFMPGTAVELRFFMADGLTVKIDG